MFVKAQHLWFRPVISGMYLLVVAHQDGNQDGGFRVATNQNDIAPLFGSGISIGGSISEPRSIDGYSGGIQF